MKLYAFLISALDEVNLRQILVRTLNSGYTSVRPAIQNVQVLRFYLSFTLLVFLTQSKVNILYYQSHSTTSTHLSVNDKQNTPRNE